jgi:peptide subunit release factor 1 (eRF1)
MSVTRSFWWTRRRRELLETAEAGRRATCGLARPLEALWLGEIQTLVVADSVHLSGSECPNCGRLEPGSLGSCPACGTAMRPLHDLFHPAIGRALEQAGNVVVHGDAAQLLLEAGGGLGTPLR